MNIKFISVHDEPEDRARGKGGRKDGWVGDVFSKNVLATKTVAIKFTVIEESDVGLMLYDFLTI